MAVSNFAEKKKTRLYSDLYIDCFGEENTVTFFYWV